MTNRVLLRVVKDMKELVTFFNNNTTEVIAKKLLGMYLEHETDIGVLAGYIVDTEAYLGPDDQAAHSFGLRKTPRLEAMYDQLGTIYLYTMHTHLLLNIVTQERGIPQGVMIRGLEPIKGIEQMEKNRGNKQGAELTNGPGKLVEALGVKKELYGASIFSSKLTLVPHKGRTPKKILSLPRIGIPNKGIWTDLPLRYAVAGNPFISKQKKATIDQENFGWEKK